VAVAKGAESNLFYSLACHEIAVIVNSGFIIQHLPDWPVGRFRLHELALIYAKQLVMSANCAIAPIILSLSDRNLACTVGHEALACEDPVRAYMQ
jgi:hypothetical protein